MKSETIQSLTPIVLAAVGGVIAVTVLLSPQVSESKWVAGMGLASTAIAGAAGIAQTAKSESSVSVHRDGQIIEADSGDKN